MTMIRALFIVSCVALPATAPLAAQRQGDAGDRSTDLRSLRPLRIAKWSTLAAAAGTAAWGFVQNSRADDRFADLERRCNAEPARCTRRTAAGVYEDAELERLYQDVRSLDRKAWAALLVSQIGLGTSVVLFLLDLGNMKRPPDIPFVPTAVEFVPRPDGALEFSVVVSIPRR